MEVCVLKVHTEVQNVAIENNDDRILHCCLVYKNKTSGSGKETGEEEACGP